MDYLVIGCGLFGSVVAEQLAQKGFEVCILERRDHIGGNCYSEFDANTGIEVHKYGSHIFHTSNEQVWNYVNRFSSFNGYRHTVWTTYQDRTYSLPINLATINSFYGINIRPADVPDFIAREAKKALIENPSNLEEKAISLIGRPLYEAFIKGYTIKQWEKDPKELPDEIITRLPVRYNFNNRYFNDKYEGLPTDGYGKFFESILDHPNIEVRLNTDYFECSENIEDIPTIYSGPIDRFFNYKHGYLDWRTIEFVREVHDVSDYQGCAVMNYADIGVSHTRIHEFKHYHPERLGTNKTIIFKEFSKIAAGSSEPYYPVNTPRNVQLLNLYCEESECVENVVFGGRLGAYRYLDMDKTIAEALSLADRIIKEKIF